jgi:hypothetical protein
VNHSLHNSAFSAAIFDIVIIQIWSALRPYWARPLNAAPRDILAAGGADRLSIFRTSGGAPARIRVP